MFNFFKQKNIRLQYVLNGRKGSKDFVNKEAALRYIDNQLYSMNTQVTEVITRTTSEEYYCNDCSRFIMFMI